MNVFSLYRFCKERLMKVVIIHNMVEQSGETVFIENPIRQISVLVSFYEVL
jgi:hypothetical protein